MIAVQGIDFRVWSQTSANRILPLLWPTKVYPSRMQVWNANCQHPAVESRLFFTPKRDFESISFLFKPPKLEKTRTLFYLRHNWCMIQADCSLNPTGIFLIPQILFNLHHGFWQEITPASKSREIQAYKERCFQTARSFLEKVQYKGYRRFTATL